MFLRFIVPAILNPQLFGIRGMSRRISWSPYLMAMHICLMGAHPYLMAMHAYLMAIHDYVMAMHAYLMAMHAYLMAIHYYLMGAHPCLMAMHAYLMGAHPYLMAMHAYLMAMHPHLIESTLSDNGARACTLVAKLVQSLANLSTFGVWCFEHAPLAVLSSCSDVQSYCFYVPSYQKQYVRKLFGISIQYLYSICFFLPNTVVFPTPILANTTNIVLMGCPILIPYNRNINMPRAFTMEMSFGQPDGGTDV
jgi:hypothetical protein